MRLLSVVIILLLFISFSGCIQDPKYTLEISTNESVTWSGIVIVDGKTELIEGNGSTNVTVYGNNVSAEINSLEKNNQICVTLWSGHPSYNEYEDIDCSSDPFLNPVVVTNYDPMDGNMGGLAMFCCFSFGLMMLPVLTRKS